MKQHVLNLLKETAYQVWSIAKWELILCTVVLLASFIKNNMPLANLVAWIFCIVTLTIASFGSRYCIIPIIIGGALYILVYDDLPKALFAFIGAYFVIQFLIYQKLILPAIIIMIVDFCTTESLVLIEHLPEVIFDYVFLMSLPVLVGVARYNYTERIAKITIENKTNQEQAAQKISSILHDTLSRELNQIIRLATQIQQNTPTLQAAQINELANHAIDDLHHIIGAITTQSTLPDRTPKLAPSSQLTLNQIATELRQLGFTVNQEEENRSIAIEYGDDLRVKTVRYYQDGQLHREEDAAVIEYDRYGVARSEEFWLNGEQMSEADFYIEKSLKYYKESFARQAARSNSYADEMPNQHYYDSGHDNSYGFEL